MHGSPSSQVAVFVGEHATDDRITRVVRARTPVVAYEGSAAAAGDLDPEDVLTQDAGDEERSVRIDIEAIPERTEEGVHAVSRRVDHLGDHAGGRDLEDVVAREACDVDIPRRIRIDAGRVVQGVPDAIPGGVDEDADRSSRGKP